MSLRPQRQGLLVATAFKSPLQDEIGRVDLELIAKPHDMAKISNFKAKISRVELHKGLGVRVAAQSRWPKGTVRPALNIHQLHRTPHDGRCIGTVVQSNQCKENASQVVKKLLLRTTQERIGCNRNE